MPTCAICGREYVAKPEATRFVSCPDHRAAWKAYTTWRWRQRKLNHKDYTYQEYLELKRTIKRTPTLVLFDSEPPDVVYSGDPKKPPCPQCKHFGKDYNRFGCVKCPERDKFANSVTEFFPFADNNCQVIARADVSHNAEF